MKILNRLFLILLVIGGINRALYAWLHINLVTTIFPDKIIMTERDTNHVERSIMAMSLMAKIVYSLIAVGAIRTLIANFRLQS